MANRTRDIPIQFFVTAEEKKMIRKKMILSRTANMGAYLRKMAIDGIIVNTDTTYLEKQFYEMHKIGVNVNQLAWLANSTGAVTPDRKQNHIRKIWSTNAETAGKQNSNITWTVPFGLPFPLMNF